jgi:DNA-directed RNA polymerase subunit RPC12/RpoP
MKHDEEMNYSCKNCKKKISAHNNDWHGGMCDECFNKMMSDA